MATNMFLELTPDELIAKGLAPVKKEFVRSTGKRVQVEAVAGGANTTDKRDANKKKSKGQMKRERKKQVKEGLCISFSHGRCQFGDRCRFSHDLASYLEQKPPDLAGSCPFSPLDECPYGVTCCWATTHKTHPPHLQAVMTAFLEKRQQEAAEGIDAESEAKRAAPMQQLPVAESIEKPVNTLDKDLQNKLWKSRYDFSKADAVLKRMGVRISQRQQQWPAQGNGDPAQGGSTERQHDAVAHETSGTADREACETSIQDQDLDDMHPAKRQKGDGLGHANGSSGGTPGDAGTSTVAAVAAGDHAAADATMQDVPTPHGTRDVATADVTAQDVPTPVGMSDAVTPVTTDITVAPSKAEVVMVEASASVLNEPSGTTPALPERDPPVPSTAGSKAAVTAAGSTQDHGREPGTAISNAPPLASSSAVEGQRVRMEWRAQDVDTPLRPQERPRLDLRSLLYLAPLTTVGNLPFRRVCKLLGADVTCGEMALATNLLQGQASEWALLKRHPSENLFGVQVCGGYPDAMARCAQLIDDNISTDFVDVNCGCPIDLVCDKGAGSSLLRKTGRLEEVIRAMGSVLSCPLTFKIRKGYDDYNDVAHTFLPHAASWGASAVTLHGRTRQQRYSKLADWPYIEQCAKLAPGLQLIGNGDIFSYTDWQEHMEGGRLATCMIARGALIKPWLFTEIKEQRHWDISAGERLDIFKRFASFGLEHWGSDQRGVETTRKFLLEWLSFTHRYIPVGLLEVLPQRMHWRPPAFSGRSDLESLLASDNAADWVRITEMLLGPVPADFSFAPKHKSNAYAAPSEADMALGGLDDDVQG